MATAPSIQTKKTFTYRGGLRTWSNRYHFVGGTPPDATHWHTLMDAVTAAEKATVHSGVVIVEAIGYAAGSDVPVATKVYSLAGTLTVGGNDKPSPGDCAALTRYSTAGRTVKNHPIYLFNYTHEAWYDSTVSADKLGTAQKTALQTYATAWITGFSDGGSVTAKRSSPRSEPATGSIVEEWITHRDFPSTTSV